MQNVEKKPKIPPDEKTALYPTLSESKGCASMVVQGVASRSHDAPALLTKPITWSEMYTVALLLIINLVNFADRFTVPSVLVSIDEEFKIEDKMILGLLQTVFVLSYMTFSPIFGYLGDRFNRRFLMAIGLFVWGCASLASSFVTSEWKNGFWIFMTLRGIIGTGEASYVTISPTIISDLFVGTRRTVILVVYQSAMLLGSGAGYMMASLVNSVTGNWHCAFLVWPPVILLCMFGLIFMKEPERGKAEGTTHLAATSYRADLSYILKVKSYVLCTLGYTSTVFVVGALSFWAPTLGEFAIELKNPDNDVSLVAFLFGVITILGGVVGAVGGTLSSKLRSRNHDSSDAIVCGFGALLAGPVIYLNLAIARYNLVLMWFLLFFSLTFLSINLVLTQEITLSVLIPTRRATGSGVQLLISHILGDAISPYLIGVLVDLFRHSSNDPTAEPNILESFNDLQAALFFTTIVCELGAFCYFYCSIFLRDDKKEAIALAVSMSSSKSLATIADQRNNNREGNSICIDYSPTVPLIPQNDGNSYGSFNQRRQKSTPLNERRFFDHTKTAV